MQQLEFTSKHIDNHIFRLENGIRVILHPQQSTITHTCMLINAGSGDEVEGKFGVAHFIEHMLFKQTERRSTNQILDRLESVGGDLNAYTTKEYTCIHASILKPYLNRALDLFEDIIFHSTFPENEIEKEKGVILDEMASYLDSPEDAIIDDFEDLIFKNSSLGHNILGLENDLKGIQREDLLTFIESNYSTEDIVIGIAGDYTKQNVEKLANKFFGKLPLRQAEKTNADTIVNIGEHVEVVKPINQAHYILGTQAYGIQDDRKTGLLLLNNQLGGLGMSSILNLSIREKHGIAYTIESNYSLYSNTGLFNIYLGTDEEKIEKAKKLIWKELNKLKAAPISESQLNKVKNKFKGQIALAEENRMSMIITEAKNLLDYNQIITLDEVFRKIDEVTPQLIFEISTDIFDESKMTSLTFLPEE
ncbi:M16 family metallopeptidase [Sphingobacterium hungaricum]|uniref:M16 family metallopeptidase n=1 Tax=Sphingobacterium hungaricum TaxID=2082723 RepID=UPI001E3C6379|nr:pitrilysin family protein [Sphingobacterium hungaricum]